ncbi:hypothetical protein FQJ89_22625 [Xanthomonas vasicola]|nr:hypothetical protein FQJ96_22355 [Xanthomonas vasicola]TWQ51696.1 hypothetical protein FQJ93_22350 [Xanthomonas vasicola]TWQ70917.1 hypothetical protein FQJ89_22625 [Xanthomonas vasicola]
MRSLGGWGFSGATNYQFYAMSTATCQPGTARSGFYTTLGFQGEKSATITIGLSNSGFSYR